MKSKIPSLAELQAQMKAQAPAGWKNSESKFPLAFLEKTPRAPRKEGVKNKHEEGNLQQQLVTYLKRCCPAVVVSAGLTGELWAARTVMGDRFFGWRNKLISKGMLAGQSDLTLFFYPSRTVFIELKKPKGGDEGSAQEQIRNRLTAAGFGCYVIRSMEELKEIIAKENIPCVEVGTDTPF